MFDLGCDVVEIDVVLGVDGGSRYGGYCGGRL